MKLLLAGLSSAESGLSNLGIDEFLVRRWFCAVIPSAIVDDSLNFDQHGTWPPVFEFGRE
jgi:hypothetical protein